MTVSAYVVRMQDDTALVLVHKHKKLQMLMQAGGHIELSETPWSALAHELNEETGYSLTELSVLLPIATRLSLAAAIVHPTPLLVNTHKVNTEHLHTDLVYAFVARAIPAQAIGVGESDDVRWLTLEELKAEVDSGIALEDTYQIYHAIIATYLEAYEWVRADSFSIDDPLDLILPEVKMS